MEKSENLDTAQLSQYLNSMFIESGQNLSNVLKSSIEVVEAMKEIYRREDGYEILNDNRKFSSYLGDLLPQNRSYILKFFREPEVTSILTRFVNDSFWDNAEYEYQIQLAVRDLDKNVGKKVEDAQTIVLWTISSLGVEFNIEQASQKEIDKKKAEHFEDEKNYESALPIWLSYAKAGDAEALNRVAIFYSQGWAVNKDEKEAIKWYEESAGLGFSYGQYNLADYYMSGKFIPQDRNKAFELYHKAALQGLAEAQIKVGKYYEQGIGRIEKNLTDASKWYEKALNQGAKEIRIDLYCVYRDMNQMDKAFKIALELANESDSIMMCLVGFAYKEGKGVKRDFSKAFEWFLKSATNGYAGGELLLGASYRDGKGIEQDFIKAKYWFEKSANQGNKHALFCLGDIFYKGQGGSKDLNKALEFYEKSEKLGFDKAKERVTHVRETLNSFEKLSDDSKNGNTLEIDRNDSCPCGSGKRFKNCHGQKSKS